MIANDDRLGWIRLTEVWREGAVMANNDRLGWIKLEDKLPKTGIPLLLLRDEGVFSASFGPRPGEAGMWFIMGFPVPVRGRDMWLYKDDLRSLPALEASDG